MKYIDTHGHIFSKKLSDDESMEQLKRLKESEVKKIILPGTTEVDSYKNLEIANGKTIFAAVGIHPSYACNSGVTQFMDNIDFKDVIGIGECGLDYYYEENPPKEIQKKVFIKHIKIALLHKLPLMIHCRDAIEDMYEILSREEFLGLRFVMHSYAGGVEWIEKFNLLDAYYSFNGITTFKKSKEHQDAARMVPLDRIVVETDSPYLTPVPHRGKINEPAFVKHVADFIAELRAEENEKVYKALWDNSCRLFNIK